MPPQQFDFPLSCLEDLYCDEDRFDDDDLGDDDGDSNLCDEAVKKTSLPALILPELDLFCEDDELASLISKEERARASFPDINENASRAEAVSWMLRVHSHYGFSALTAVLAVNYFDRFLCSLRFQRDKPWMGQLTGVACLSLAAKVEETQVPLLLDLQGEGSKYAFEAKMIQRMELLVLSTLQWKMNPVTPFSFVDHFTRRLGMRNCLQWGFMWRCEHLLLSVIADSRFVCYLPSMIAAAVMILVIREVKFCDPMEYQNQIISVLKISEEELSDCLKLMVELPCIRNPFKRKSVTMPDSPNGVMDASFSSANSNDSSSVQSSVSSSPEPLIKRIRSQDQPFNNRISVILLGSPP